MKAKQINLQRILKNRLKVLILLLKIKIIILKKNRKFKKSKMKIIKL